MIVGVVVACLFVVSCCNCVLLIMIDVCRLLFVFAVGVIASSRLVLVVCVLPLVVQVCSMLFVVVVALCLVRCVVDRCPFVWCVCDVVVC